MNRKRKGYIKKLNTPNKNRKIGVGIETYEVNKNQILLTGNIYTGRNKRIIINHLYNREGKRNEIQRKEVIKNRYKRSNYKK